MVLSLSVELVSRGWLSFTCKSKDIMSMFKKETLKRFVGTDTLDTNWFVITQVKHLKWFKWDTLSVSWKLLECGITSLAPFRWICRIWWTWRDPISCLHILSSASLCNTRECYIFRLLSECYNKCVVSDTDTRKSMTVYLMSFPGDHPDKEKENNKWILRILPSGRPLRAGARKGDWMVGLTPGPGRMSG